MEDGLSKKKNELTKKEEYNNNADDIFKNV